MISVFYEYEGQTCGDCNTYTDTGQGVTYGDVCDAIFDDLFDDYSDGLENDDDEIEVTVWNEDQTEIIAEGLVYESGWDYKLRDAFRDED